MYVDNKKEEPAKGCLLYEADWIEYKDSSDLNIDDEVIVWDGVSDGKFKRHFSHFDSCGNIRCFRDGKTSFTSDGATSYWKHWELPDENRKSL
jgi:hypothetical protein